MTRHLLLAGIPLLLATGSAGAATRGLRLPTDVVPTAQAIELRIDPAQDTYTGSVTIDLEVKRATSSFELHARGETIESLELASERGPIAATHLLVKEDERLVVETSEPLAAGAKLRLTVRFTQRFNRRAAGLYKATAEGDAYIATQFEETEAREAFPCFDEPNFKLPYQVTLEVPKGQVALANTRPETETESAGWKRIRFRPTLRLPSYLLAVAVGPWELVDVPGTSIPTRIVTPRNQAKLAAGAVSETPPILAYLEKWFERPYPFDKLDLIAVPEFAFGAMENPGLIVFRDSILLADPTRDTPAERRNRTGVIAHELAHMWFGDVVTMEWWDDLWLNESFADWLGDRTIDELYPELEIGLRSLRELAGTMHNDSQPNAEAIRLPVDSPPEAAFQNLDIVYNKGHAVLDMVEGWLSKETFRKGVVHYINKFEWRNARGPDLWNALAEVSKQDVPAVLTTFVAQPGYPLLDFERVGARGVRVRQRRFATAGAEVTPQTWRVPILLRYADEAGVHASPVLLTEAEQTFTLPESSTAGRGKIRWFHPDADVRGYYRWRLPAATLADLAAHAGERLNVRERVALLGNLEALLQAGAIDGSTYVSLLVPFAKDSEPSVLTALADRVEALDETFFAAAAPVDRIRYAAFVRQLFGPSAHELGWRQVEGESDALRTLRPRLLGFVGEEGADAALRQQARDMVAGYLASGQEHRPLDPDIAPTALRLAALDGDRALFDQLVAGFEAAKIPQDVDRFLGALGSFRTPELADAALTLALSEKVRGTQVFAVGFRIADEGEAGEDRLFNWTTTNYAALSKKLPPFALGFLPGVAGSCSVDRLARAEAFFSDPSHQVPGTGKQMAKTASKIRACAALREREGKAVRREVGESVASVTALPAPKD